MTRVLSQRILFVESLGYALVFLALWLDELLDLPHRLFGAPATPVNWTESLFETAVLLLCAALTLTVTRRLIARIHLLEEFVPVCARCKRLRLPQGDPFNQKAWVEADDYLRESGGATVSHSLCPDCAHALYPDLYPRAAEGRDTPEV